MTKRDSLMMELLREMRDDIKALQVDMAGLKAERRIWVWVSGIVASVITYFATNLPFRFFNS